MVRNKPHTLIRANPKGDGDEVLCWTGWVQIRWTNWALDIRVRRGKLH